MPKMNRRLDSLTTFRQRTPTNEQTADNFTRMVFDHNRQRAVVPGINKVMSATRGVDVAGYRTTNTDGKPFALGVDSVGGRKINVGGAPDAPGTDKFRRD